MAANATIQVRLVATSKSDKKRGTPYVSVSCTSAYRKGTLLNVVSEH